MLPPIKIVENTSGNANNNPLGIKIERKAQPFAAILCQEHYEWWVKIWFFLAGFVPVLLFKFPPLNRWLEFRGHAVECAVAYHYYGINRAWYIEKEASDMVGGYSGLFSKNFTTAEVIQKLQELQPWADKWVENRFELIEKYASMDPKKRII
jgi:hypothetical protein